MYLKVQSSFVLFYFKEERQSLRQLLVEIFGCLCGLKKEILSQLLCSVLPSELVMEIMKRKEGKKIQGITTLIDISRKFCTFKLFDPEIG